jgi:hypothetical protein
MSYDVLVGGVDFYPLPLIFGKKPHSIAQANKQELVTKLHS